MNRRHKLPTYLRPRSPHGAKCYTNYLLAYKENEKLKCSRDKLHHWPQEWRVDAGVQRRSFLRLLQNKLNRHPRYQLRRVTSNVSVPRHCSINETLHQRHSRPMHSLSGTIRVPEKNLNLLTRCLCGYYTTSLINFAPFSTVHSIFLAYSSDLTTLFYNLTSCFLWPASRSYKLVPLHNPHIFSPSHSRPFTNMPIPC